MSSNFCLKSATQIQTLSSNQDNFEKQLALQTRPFCTPHVRMYVCMCVCKYVCMYIYMYVYMYVRMYVYIYVYVYVCVYVYICMHFCMYACMFVSVYACMYVNYVDVGMCVCKGGLAQREARKFSGGFVTLFLIRTLKFGTSYILSWDL